MVNLLSSIIFTVTALHEIFGYVVDNVALPTTSGFRLTIKDSSKIDLQSFLYSTVLAASTSLRMPKLINEFNNFFGKDENGKVDDAIKWEIDVWRQFQDSLKVQSKKVKEDNKKNIEFE